ncbi:MAG: ATP-dependent Clp protease proteolytic subunit [Phycisphaerales bacterium]
MGNGLLDKLRNRSTTLSRIVASAAALVCLVAALGQGGQNAPAAPTGAPPAAAVPAARQARNVAVITIAGAIDPNTAKSFGRRMAIAERAGAEAIVVELDTPGGDVSAVIAICTEIKASRITNTVGWVNRTAFSGGAVIAVACREMVTSDPGTMGDALPVLGGPILFSQLPVHEQQKLTAPVIAELVDSARKNGYDEFLVQGMASRGVELWLVENRETGQRFFVNRTEYLILFGDEPPTAAPSLASAELEQEGSLPPDNTLQQLLKDAIKQRRLSDPMAPPPDPSDESRFVPAAPGLENMSGEVTKWMKGKETISRPQFTRADHGRWSLVEYASSGTGPFVFKADQMRKYGLASATINNDEQLKAFFGAKNLIRLTPSWSEGLVAFMTLWYVRALLVVVFLVGLFVEMTHPGLVAPGVVSMAALIGLIAPPLLVDMSAWWTVAAILGGISLIAIEIFVIPGFGVPGIIGLLMLFGGLVGTLVPTGAFFPDTPAQRNDLLFGVATLLMAVATSGVIMYFIGKHLTSLPVVNRLILKDPVPTDDQAGHEMLAAMAQAPVRVGMAGTALTPLRPAGRMQLGDRIIDVVSDVGYIPAGASVKIASVSDFRVGVELA